MGSWLFLGLALNAVLQVFPYVSGFIGDYMTIVFSPLWTGILASLLLMMLRSCLLRRDKPLHKTLWVRLCRAVPGCAGLSFELQLLVAMKAFV